MENNKKYKAVLVSAAAFIFMCCCAVVSYAQRMDIVSYVPVKSGFYDSLVTKNKTIFNSEVSNNIFNLTVHSSILSVEAKEGIVFQNLLTPRLYLQNSYLNEGTILEALTESSGGVGISFITLRSESAVSVLKGSAKQLNVSEALAGGDGSLSTRSITVGLDENVTFKIQVPDGCTNLGWKTVNAYPVANYINDDKTLIPYKILSCLCSTGATGCENP